MDEHSYTIQHTAPFGTIRAARKAKGLTLLELSLLCNPRVHVCDLSQIERGLIFLGEDRGQRIANALGIPLERVMEGRKVSAW